LYDFCANPMLHPLPLPYVELNDDPLIFPDESQDKVKHQE
jgi:hypothetical protein